MNNEEDKEIFLKMTDVYDYVESLELFAEENDGPVNFNASSILWQIIDKEMGKFSIELLGHNEVCVDCGTHIYPNERYCHRCGLRIRRD